MKYARQVLYLLFSVDISLNGELRTAGHSTCSSYSEFSFLQILSPQYSLVSIKCLGSFSFNFLQFTLATSRVAYIPEINTTGLHFPKIYLTFTSGSFLSSILYFSFKICFASFFETRH